MDINGDNKLDIVSGGAEGLVYTANATEDGQFTKPEPLKDKAGKHIGLGEYFDAKLDKWQKHTSFQHIDVALHPVAVDWDNDGDLDLLLSGHSGLVAIRLNEGTAQKAEYAEKNTYITIGDSTLSLGKGTNARYVDWDGDGLNDLVCGVSQIGVVWFKNKGSKSQPSFEEPRALVSVSKENADDPYGNITAEVTDLNGDGKKDLLVGAVSSGKKDKVWLYYQK